MSKQTRSKSKNQEMSSDSGADSSAKLADILVISESEHQKGRAIPHVSYSREGHTSFPEFFNENFCDVAFHFSYRLSFSFHLLWFNLVFYYRY